MNEIMCTTCNAPGADRRCHQCEAPVHDSLSCCGYGDSGVLCLSCEAWLIDNRNEIKRLAHDRDELNRRVCAQRAHLEDLEGELEALEDELEDAREGRRHRRSLALPPIGMQPLFESVRA